MARKHFEEYYNQVCNQFFSLEDAFKEMSEEVQNNMVEPERLKQLQKTIEPIKNNYQTLSYIKYLLDKPTKKSKHAKYDKQSKKLISKCGDKTGDKLLKKNSSIISSLKS